MDSKQMKAFAQSVGLARAERMRSKALRRLRAAEHVAESDRSLWWSEGQRWRVKDARKRVDFWTEVVAQTSAAEVTA